MLKNNSHQVTCTSVYHFSPGRKVEEQKCSSEKRSLSKRSDECAPPELEVMNRSSTEMTSDRK